MFGSIKIGVDDQGKGAGLEPVIMVRTDCRGEDTRDTLLQSMFQLAPNFLEVDLRSCQDAKDEFGQNGQNRFIILRRPAAAEGRSLLLANVTEAVSNAVEVLRKILDGDHEQATTLAQIIFYETGGVVALSKFMKEGQRLLDGADKIKG